MLKDQAIDNARREAIQHGCEICIVEDPLGVRSHNEFEEGPYAFGPFESLPYIYAWGIIIGTIDATGVYKPLPKPIVVDESKFNDIKDRETFESLAA